MRKWRLGYCVLVLMVLVNLVYAHSIIVDGDASDWIGTPGAEGTLVFSGQEAIWNDYADDDIGDGGDALLASDNPSAYTYPTSDTLRWDRWRWWLIR